jgi:phosphosulfolactate phosphohydrolase-like enzyme
MMVERDLEHEVHFAAKLSSMQAVPRLVDGRLTV